MARIENQQVYPFKTPVSLGDYVIGTDFSEQQSN